MTRTTTKCEWPRCRNVGRKEYDLVAEEDGEFLAEYVGQSYICKKHLLEALDRALSVEEGDGDQH